MESKQTSFNTSLAYGQEGEHLVANLFLSQSFYVMPLYQFTSSAAPVILCSSGSLTSPDLMVWKAGKPFFCEVKRKRQWVKYENLETGLNYNHYESYRKLSDATGIPCYLFFIQEEAEPKGIYFTEIHNERHRLWNGRNNSGNYIQKPMVFFVSESLTKIH